MVDWNKAAEALRGKLSPEEEQILSLLADGKTQPEIGASMGLHRSAVWRRVQRLRTRLEELDQDDQPDSAATP